MIRMSLDGVECDFLAAEVEAAPKSEVGDGVFVYLLSGKERTGWHDMVGEVPDPPVVMKINQTPKGVVMYGSIAGLGKWFERYFKTTEAAQTFATKRGWQTC